MTWTDAARTRQSAIASAWWRKQVEADPHAHPLKRLRAERDYTQADLAAMCDLPPSAIGAIETSGRASKFMQKRIAECLKVPISQLFAPA
jgi:DNA-binding XRE family transcriptional regulator